MSVDACIANGAEVRVSFLVGDDFVFERAKILFSEEAETNAV
jgi:hypothetical protein